jgi:nucleotide-binding universal stress UspA family protein
MSIFPAKILLGTDSSEEAELALSAAIDLANDTNSQLHVVTVGPWSPDPAYAVHEASFRWEYFEQASEAIGKEAQEILDNLGEEDRGGRGERARSPSQEGAKRPGDRSGC